MIPDASRGGNCSGMSQAARWHTTGMMVLINGPFGIGKTTTAQALIQRLPDSQLFDPEIIGASLRALLGPLWTGSDYQDLPLWRSQTINLASCIHADYGRTLVVPMTLWRRDYFDEITGGWRSHGAEVVCFRLIASRETVIERILSRPERDGPHDWCLSHLDAGLTAANDPAFGIEIETDDRTPAEIAQQIANSLS